MSQAVSVYCLCEISTVAELAEQKASRSCEALVRLTLQYIISKESREGTNGRAQAANALLPMLPPLLLAVEAASSRTTAI